MRRLCFRRSIQRRVFPACHPCREWGSWACSVCSVCRSCAVPLCPVRSLLRRSVCGPTWWSISRCTDARPTTTPASRGRTTPAPGTAASPHPRRSSWTARSLKKNHVAHLTKNTKNLLKFVKTTSGKSVLFFLILIKKKGNANLTKKFADCWSENNPQPLFCVCRPSAYERLRACSETQHWFKNT